MITQAIKRWLHTMFAWRPWKHTPPEAYRQASGPSIMNTTQEGISRSAVEGITAQTSISPRLSTIEERPEHTISAPKPATNEIAETSPPPALRSPADSATEPGNGITSPAAISTPTQQQRLEFLRYLVVRGIINEGSGEK